MLQRTILTRIIHNYLKKFSRVKSEEFLPNRLRMTQRKSPSTRRMSSPSTHWHTNEPSDSALLWRGHAVQFTLPAADLYVCVRQPVSTVVTTSCQAAVDQVLAGRWTFYSVLLGLRLLKIFLSALYDFISARQYCLARYMLSPVRLSVYQTGVS